jgi:alpha-tubulin suppressor-like RCC1 family protein
MSSLIRIFAAAALVVLSAACNETVEPLALAGPPAITLSISGDAQLGSVGTPLPAPFVVRVVDTAGASSPGAIVEWTTTGGTLSQVADTTDADGQASVLLTLPASSGSVTVTAHVDGLTDVVFTATASPGSTALLTFRYIEAGSYHACGITTTEESVCWGFNEDGQVGAGVFSTVAPLTRVSTDRTVRMSSGGRHHSCEVTLSGEVWCGGSNAAGQLDGAVGPGRSTFSWVTPPVATTFRVMQAGLLHTCALSLSKQLWCWGSNGEGQIGVGPLTPDPGTTVVPLDGFVFDNVNAVTTTGLHTCAIRTNGDAQCWGWNESGQLGDGTTTTRGTPDASVGVTFRTEPDVVPHAPDPDFYIPGQAYISAGFAHTCGITTGNQALCWGENENGQLGRGNLTDASSPVAVAGGLSWRAISAGFKHTCGLALDGQAYCWGNNDFGQLGDASTTQSTAPVLVSGGLIFQSISAGETFTCGVTTAGAAYCWGDNVYGQLGQPGPAARTPQKLPFQP